MLSHAAKDQFAKPGMTVGARDDHSGADIAGQGVQLGARILVLVLRYDEFRSGYAVK
jgi:hypothetical protein